MTGCAAGRSAILPRTNSTSAAVSRKRARLIARRMRARPTSRSSSAAIGGPRNSSDEDVVDDVDDPAVKNVHQKGGRPIAHPGMPGRRWRQADPRIVYEVRLGDEHRGQEGAPRPMPVSPARRINKGRSAYGGVDPTFVFEFAPVGDAAITEIT